MSAIVACGCYLPHRRLPLTALSGRAPAADDPQRTVAWYDEDSVTMAVAAAIDCLQQRDRAAIDLLIFATTTYAYAEKQGAVMIASALDLPATTATVDVAHSLRGGLQAVQLAFDAVAAGSARQALIVAADCRAGAPGSEIERNAGDAAVALLIGRDAGVQLLGRSTHGAELIDVWRRAGDRFSHSWEERFVQQHGYLEQMSAAAAALRAERDDAESWRWVLGAPDARSHQTLSRQLGVERSAVQAPLFGRVGFCGAADALLQLVAALGSAAPGQRFAVVSPGDGAEALLLGADQAVRSDAFARALAEPARTVSLEAYRRARNLNVSEYPAIDDQGISATVHFREQAENISFSGQRCACGAPQFPRGRVCIRCGNRDQWTPECFAQAYGTLQSFTLDAFFPAPEPPTPVGVVQIDNGPRVYLQLADLTPKEVAPGMTLRFVFRCIHRAGLRPNYFWKAVPVAIDLDDTTVNTEQEAL